jgi:phosphohistidine phosphatase
MQRLILMRHAKAERAAPSGEDVDRSLTNRGREDARIIGRVLAAAGWTPTAAWVSSAQRTRDTWEVASEAFGEVEVTFDRALYHATSRAMLTLIEADEGAPGTVMIVGHNPGMHQLAMELLIAGAASARDIGHVRSRFPTATAVVFEIDAAGRPGFDGLYLAADHGGGGGE